MEELSLKEIQSVSLEILKDVHCFCENNDIKYTLAYGTLIGAIRHHGFIPWDNDIDICMPRPDYEKFIQTYKSNSYELAYLDSPKYDCLATYARVFDKRTVAINFNWIKEPVGVWIDIFPLDGVPDDLLEFKTMYNQYAKIWRKLILKKIQFCRFSDKKNILDKLKLFLRKCRRLNGLGGHHSYRVYNRIIQKIPFGQTKHCSQMTVMDNGPVEHIPISIFSEMIRLDFEDTTFFAVKDYDTLLKLVYNNYMELPPENQRIAHQDYIKFYRKK